MVAFWMADGDGGLIKSQSLKRRQLLSLIHHNDHHWIYITGLALALNLHLSTRELIENKKLMATKTFSYSKNEARHGKNRCQNFVKIFSSFIFFLFIYSTCSSGNRFTSLEKISRMCVYAIFFITALSSSIVRKKVAVTTTTPLSFFTLEQKSHCDVYNHKYVQNIHAGKKFLCLIVNSNSHILFYIFLFLKLTRAKL